MQDTLHTGPDASYNVCSRTPPFAQLCTLGRSTAMICIRAHRRPGLRMSILQAIPSCMLLQVRPSFTLHQVLLCSGSHVSQRSGLRFSVLLHGCRGVAKFRGGVPMRMNSVRMLWGQGVRAGLYPLSDTEAYWFTTKNCPSVCSPGFNLTVDCV